MNRHRPNSPDPRKQHTRSPSPTLQPTKAVPPPPRAGKHTSPTPEPHGRHAAAFPARLGQVRRRRKARHTRTSPPPPPARLGEVAPRRPGGSSGSRAAAGPLPGSVRLGPQPPRRSPRWPRLPAPRASAARNLPQRRCRGQRARPGARVRPSAPAHPRRRRPQEMHSRPGKEGASEGRSGPASTGSARRRRRLLRPPLSAESRAGPRLGPRMQPGMNAR